MNTPVVCPNCGPAAGVYDGGSGESRCRACGAPAPIAGPVSNEKPWTFPVFLLVVSLAAGAVVALVELLERITR